jgi:hypothetical protein
MVHKSCQKWLVKLKEILEKPSNKHKNKAQQLFLLMKSIQLHQTDKKLMVKYKEELSLKCLL